MRRVRIIGIGSPFGDDCVGWNAIDAIESSGLRDRFPFVETFHCVAPAVDLPYLLMEVDAAILIDAARSGGVPGSVRKIDASELAPASENISSHAFSVAESLGLIRALGALPKVLILYGVEAGKGYSLAAMQTLMAAIATDLQVLLPQFSEAIFKLDP